MKHLLKNPKDWVTFLNTVKRNEKPRIGGNPEFYPCVLISDYDYIHECFVNWFVYLKDFEL